MRDSRKQYIAVGTFLLLILTVSVVWLGLLSGFTHASNRYYMEFQNVMGLTEGAHILYEGYPVGEIDRIIFNHEPTTAAYRVEVAIRDDWTLPRDSLAVITQSGLLAAVVIDIHAGHSQHMLAPGDRIPSQQATNMLTVMASVANRLGELATTNLEPLLENLTHGTGSLKTLAQDAPVILANLKTFTAQLNETTERLNGLIDQSGGHVESILTDVAMASNNLSTLTLDFRRTSRRLDKLLHDVDSLVTHNEEDIEHSVEDLQHTLEVLASHVQEISFNLETTTRNMSEFTAEIRQNPGVIIRGKAYREEHELVNSSLP